MKKVLITGSNSYIGTSFENYLNKWSNIYQVDVVSTINDEWKTLDFSKYDCIYHVAGLAHSDTGNVSLEMKTLYYRINTDLAVDVALKARKEGTKQFIFMSSSIVYGDSAPIGKKKTITKDTPCNPKNFYGDSKVKAENALLLLNSDDFKVVILRCPMIYGKNSKGNYQSLRKIAVKLPFFIRVSNSRTMLYIGNLVEFVRLMIDNEESGIFWPCNREMSITSELVKMIASANGKKIILVPGFQWILRLLSHFFGIINKAFGNLEYENKIGDYKQEYRLYSLQESIKETEIQ